MASLNRVQLLGSLNDDPELRFTSSGKSVVNFMLDVEGESPNVFPIIIWGKLGELCIQQLKKGSQIYLEGRLVIGDKTVIKTIDTFDGDEFEVEENKYSVRVVAKKIEFLDNHQPRNSVIGTKETIEYAIEFLRLMSMDPMTDHKMVLEIIYDLSSLDFENMD